MDIPRLRVLVVGSGGREHALAWKLSQSSSVDKIFVAPGNGGTEGHNVENVNIPVSKHEELVEYAKSHDVNLVVVGPEEPLVAGIEGKCRAAGIRCFGPSQRAARMEGSKAFSKAFMQKHGIPTATFQSFTDYESAKRYLDSLDHDVVIKADGLASGKGVVIPTSKVQAHAALKEIMVQRQFGDAGNKIVIEEFLEGEELSVLTFSDGYTIRSLPPAQDHKRLEVGDKGPNTGGMGAYAPTRTASKELMAKVDREIVQRTIDCMRRDGMPFVGMLFTGLMITKNGPKVLEYNVRGGDPETQTLLPLVSKETDLGRVMLACTEQWLDGVELQIDPGFATTVVACSGGYPNAYETGKAISLPERQPSVLIFHAGTVRVEDQLLTSGGRVIASTALGSTLEEAVEKANTEMAKIKFEGKHYRTDIAHRAFKFDAERGMTNGDAGITYSGAGVSIDAGNTLVSRIKAKVKSTARPGADADIGGFGGTFSLAQAGYNKQSPTLIGAIDGVGTKLKIAHAINKHDTVGIDLVAMNVNDLIVQGAEPLMFLDCYTCSILDVETAASFVTGVADGCKASNCALVGGETAEMPGLLQSTEYDAVGAAIGAVNTAAGKIILPDKQSMTEGDVLLGLASDGLHSNGFSLVRKIIEKERLSFEDPCPWMTETLLGEALLVPTRIYVRSLLEVVKQDLVKGMAHITGGGLTENVPRMIPAHLEAKINLSTWERPKVFKWLQDAGHVSQDEILRVLNNGIGMVLCVSKDSAVEVKQQLEILGEKVHRIGSLVNRLNDNGCTFEGEFCETG